MADYPVSYEADYAAERSRLHTFFRLLAAIPAAIVVYLQMLGVIVTAPVTWIVMVLTGRYLPALYAYHSGALRAGTRVGAYMMLVTDRYPPLGLGEAPDYPVRVAIAPAQAQYDRLKALIRLILFIPVYVVSYLLVLVAEAAAVVSWFVIVVTGRQPGALQSVINMGCGYQARAMAYLLLLTEQWPPLSGIELELEPRAPSAGGLPPTVPAAAALDG